MGSERGKYEMSVEVEMQREMAYREKLQELQPKQGTASVNCVPSPNPIPFPGSSSIPRPPSQPILRRPPSPSFSQRPKPQVIGPDSLLSRRPRLHPNPFASTSRPTPGPRPISTVTYLSGPYRASPMQKSAFGSPRPSPSPRPISSFRPSAKPTTGLTPSTSHKRREVPHVQSDPMQGSRGPKLPPFSLSPPSRPIPSFSPSSKPITVLTQGPSHKRKEPPQWLSGPTKDSPMQGSPRPKQSKPISSFSPPSSKPTIRPSPSLDVESAPIRGSPRPKSPSNPNHKRKLVCEVCKVKCCSNANLQMHLMGQKHKCKVKGFGEGKVGDPQLHCDLCGIWCINDFSFNQHVLGKTHIKKLHS